MTSRTRGPIRIAVLSIVCLTAVGVHHAHPHWGYAPLAAWLVLMAVIYGVSIWLWGKHVE